MTVEIRHSALKPFGVEVDIDCTADFTEEQKAELRRIYESEGLILIRSQNLTMDQQRDFTGIFGPVLKNAFENSYVSNVRSDGILGTTEILFHNDVTFLPSPYLGASLHAIDVGEGAAATRFASGMRAYEKLPEQLRARIQSLSSLQVRAHGDNRRTRLVDLQPGDICAVHPVVGRQDRTSRPYLFVNPVATDQIIGLSERESEELLAELFAYLYAEAEVYRHPWKLGDIIVWDNLAVHHARDDASGATRTLQRVTITELGYGDQYPLDVKKMLQEKDTKLVLAEKA